MIDTPGGVRSGKRQVCVDGKGHDWSEAARRRHRARAERGRRQSRIRRRLYGVEAAKPVFPLSAPASHPAGPVHPLPALAAPEVKQTKPQDGISPATLGLFAAAFVGFAFALVHAQPAGLHPHLLALTKPATVALAVLPEELPTRQVEMSDARFGGALPVIGDLSVLKSEIPSPKMPSEIVDHDRDLGHDVSPGIDPQSAAATDATDASVAAPDTEALTGETTQLPPLSLAPLDGTVTAIERSLETLGSRERLCEVETYASGPPQALGLGNANAFGKALAAAAIRQTGDFVVYTDKYRHMSFPMGDVPSMFGVCTDVVIRAFRGLGIDLQARIHAAHIGSGDKSIAHRRTFTLRRYFASRGASLPITTFAEDYAAGDIVTYHRPQNRGSRDHIAIVTDIIARSGRPMIVHNRGWGPQLEDALFVDRITGHYRYRGRTEPVRLKSRAPDVGGQTAGVASSAEPKGSGAAKSPKPNVKSMPSKTNTE